MALALASAKVPTGSCKKLLVWLARAYDAGERDWLTCSVIAKLCGCAESTVARAVEEIRKMPATVSGKCLQNQRASHGKCGCFNEVRLTDDGLLYALEYWPKEVLERMPRDVITTARGLRSAEYLAAAKAIRDAKQKVPGKRWAA
jgi:hypothetical protein